MYNRLRRQHGAYGLGIYDLPDARVVVNSCCLAYVIHDGKALCGAHTPNELVINHCCGKMCGARPPLRHWLQP